MTPEDVLVGLGHYLLSQASVPPHRSMLPQTVWMGLVVPLLGGRAFGLRLVTDTWHMLSRKAGLTRFSPLLFVSVFCTCGWRESGLYSSLVSETLCFCTWHLFLPVVQFCLHAHAHTCTHMQARTRTNTHKHMHTHKHRHTHKTRTFTRTNTHTNSCTDIHTQTEDI